MEKNILLLSLVVGLTCVCWIFLGNIQYKDDFNSINRLIQYWHKELDILFCSMTHTNLTFSKHPLHVQFDQVLAEIFEDKDTRHHFFYFLNI